MLGDFFLKWFSQLASSKAKKTNSVFFLSSVTLVQWIPEDGFIFAMETED